VLWGILQQLELKIWLKCRSLVVDETAAVRLADNPMWANGSPRLLQSISVTPAIADAQSFPNGQVQFTAVGNYSQPPSPSPITQSGWSLSDPNIAAISRGGFAQCNPGASGMVTVIASTSGPCSGTAVQRPCLLGPRSSAVLDLRLPKRDPDRLVGLSASRHHIIEESRGMRLC
jgi:hypothetical protein